jgi:hypothetical protein
VARCVRHARVSSDFENRLLSRRLAGPDSSPSASGGAAAPFEDSLAAPHQLRVAAEHSDLLACGVDEFAARLHGARPLRLRHGTTVRCAADPGSHRGGQRPHRDVASLATPTTMPRFWLRGGMCP